MVFPRKLKGNLQAKPYTLADPFFFARWVANSSSQAFRISSMSWRWEKEKKKIIPK